MNLRWRSRALQDLRNIASYIAAHGSPAAAERVRKHLRTRVNRLATRPFLGVATSNPAIRVLPPTRYPYRIYYAVLGDDVVILHIDRRRRTSDRSVHDCVRRLRCFHTMQKSAPQSDRIYSSRLTPYAH